MRTRSKKNCRTHMTNPPHSGGIGIVRELKNTRYKRARISKRPLLPECWRSQPVGQKSILQCLQRA